MAKPKETSQNWTYNTENDDHEDTASSLEVEWTASEYIAHHKNPAWYLLLGIATLILAVSAYFITERDLITVVTIMVVAVGFGVLASRKPQTLHYRVEASGIKIGEKLYPYGLLRSFSVQSEGAINSIQVIPFKRFMPAISLYYPPDQEQEILNTLGNYLPHEERSPDMVDKLMRRLRF